VRRVSVRGISGSGKTTFSQALATRLGVPWLELDAVHHIGPNWTEATAEQLQESVRAFIDSAPDGWVIDGNYDGKLGDLVTASADTVVWLDPPLHLALRRLLRRTISRIRDRTELWGGNRESWRTAFVGRDSLFGFTIRTYARRRDEWPERFARFPELEVVHLTSPAEARRWLEAQE